MGSVHAEYQTDAAGPAGAVPARDDAGLAEGGRRPSEGGAAHGGPSGRREFAHEHGPFHRYRRTVSWSTAPDGAVTVDQQVEWTLAFPYWRGVCRAGIGRGPPGGNPPRGDPLWVFPHPPPVRQSSVVATMAAYSVVAGLVYALLTQVLTFADADIGNGSSGQQSAVFAIARIGVVVTMVAMVFADRVGRRRVALWSFGIAVALSVATGLAPGLGVLTALQLVSRNLAVAGLLAVDTISVEELPAGSRAMAAALSAMAYGLGAGFVVLCLPLADLASWGWRLIFLASAVTIPLIVSAARNLPESGRYERMAQERAPGGVDSSGEVRRIRGGRFVLLATMFFLLNLFIAPASQLQNDYLRVDRGFSGWTITVFTVLTSTPAAIGVVVGGRWADTRSRRSALIPGLLAIGVFNGLFFALAGPQMWVVALFAAVLGGLSVASLGVLGPELFPTARRGGVRGALTVVAVTGSVLGLVLAGAGVDRSGYGPTFLLLGLGPVVAAGLAVAVPETSRRELEDINRPG